MIWHVLTLLPYVAATVACIVLGVRRQRAIAEKERLAAEFAARPRTGGGIVFRPFSVFVNGYKLSMATGHDLRFSADQTLLTVRQLVSGSAAYPERDACARLLRDTFVASSTVVVEVGPIDGDALALGDMRVVAIDYTTDFKTGVTKLVAELTGPTIVDAAKVPLTESRTAVVQKAFVFPAVLGPVDPVALAKTFDAIERCAHVVSAQVEDAIDRNLIAEMDRARSLRATAPTEASS